MKFALCLAAACLAGTFATAGAAPPSVDVTPTNINFGSQRFETQTIKSFTISNRGDATVLISVEQIQVGDDFSPGQIESTCPLTDSTPLDPGQSCTHVVGFRPSQFFAGHELALMRVVVRNTAGQIIDSREVRLIGRGY